MKIKLFALTMGTLFFLNGLVAQQVLSLQDCIEIGLERNFSIQLARNYEAISSNNVSLGNAGFLPSLDLRGQQSGVVNNGIHNTTTSAGLSLGWTLFDGFRVSTTYDRLEALQEMGELSTRMTVENFVARIAAEYYNYIQQQRLLENLKYAVDLSRERTRIDEERYLLGSGSKLQLLQSQVFLNADSSRLGRQYEVVRASRIRLNELMAVEDLKRQLVTGDTTIAMGPILVYETLEAGTLRENTELKIAAKNQVISEYDQKIIASRQYPFVSLSSGYGLTYNTYQSGSMDSQRNLGMNYGLTLGFNIFDGWNQRRRMNNAAIDLENRRLMYADIENSVRADLITIYNNYINNLRLLDLETQNLEVANETLDIALERYLLGALAGLELREAQKSLLDAEERLLSIQYQVKVAELSLLQISGRIMDYL